MQKNTLFTVNFYHNSYQLRGGEDSVLDAETGLLKSRGHKIVREIFSNAKINNFFGKFIAFFSSIYNVNTFHQVKKNIETTKPCVIHVHNYFPLISPSIFYAAKKSKTPIVHTLHNYRAVCPSALLMHDGEINEKSIKNSSFWTVRQKVYKNSYLGSLAIFFMCELHKIFNTWSNNVDRFIALTEFSKQKYIEAGWPEEKIMVKPNFIEDPYKGLKSLSKNGGYAVFVGRLSEEKGLHHLVQSWKGVNYPLKVVGEGPLEDSLKALQQINVEFMGKKEKKDVLSLIQNADFLIMPSTWYEGFPMVLVESFASGTPALVSKLGSMEEIIEHGVNGMHFEPGNSQSLADKVNWMINNPKAVKEMGLNARQEYLSKYTPEKNYEILIDIYKQAIQEAKS